jgi:hypothetical protein
LGSYYTEKQHEYIGLTKLNLDKNFAILTLTIDKAHGTALKDGLAYNYEELQVCITRDHGVGKPSELRIYTTHPHM